MNALLNKRPSQKSQPFMERLDMRIAPATVPMAGVLVAELRVETRQVRNGKRRLRRPSLAGSTRTLIHRMAGEERVIGRQDVRWLASKDKTPAALVRKTVFPRTSRRRWT